MVPGTVQQCTVQTKEDTVQYILIDAQAPPRPQQLRHIFPVCITILWVQGSYTARQLLQ